MTQDRLSSDPRAVLHNLRSNGSGFCQVIGSQIRAARLEIGFGLKDFAESFGLTLAQLERIEQGFLRVSPDQLYDVALCCNKLPSFFFPKSDLVTRANRVRRS